MRFAQIIKFTTRRIDELNAFFDAWKVQTEGARIPHRAVLRKDRDADDLYVLTIEFACYNQALANSRRPATTEFATFLANISDSPLTFQNLDLVWTEDL